MNPLIRFPDLATFSILCSILLFSSSCRKDKICLEGQEHYCNPTLSYMPLAVGNYWIYDVVNFNTNTHTGTYLNDSDTMKIIGTTNIGSEEYYIIEKDRWLTSEPIKDTLYWRDSLTYIVNEKGEIKFSASDFDNILHTRIISEAQEIYIEYVVQDSSIVYITPNNELFQCLDYNGCFWKNGEKDSRPLHSYFAKNVGLVYENIYYSSTVSGLDFRRELSKYHLEN